MRSGKAQDVGAAACRERLAVTWGNYLRAGLDRAAAAVVLAVAAPLMVACGLAVWLSMGRPVFFRQERPGRSGQLFTLYKFRTMRDARVRDGKPLLDAQRLTRLGRFLRSTSLDELPTLLNVLKGDMSLVGPRPLLPEYLPRYTPFQARRHEVKPGITGWAQINGRNALNWEKKLELDVWYVDRQSFWLDVKILWRTLGKVLCREGISRQGHATMPEFLGTAPVGSEPQRVSR